MEYLYLDESGDLGDPRTKGASNHLVISVLRITSAKARKDLEKCVERALKNKVRRRAPRCVELKGSDTTLAEKQYFFVKLLILLLSFTLLYLKKRNTAMNCCIAKTASILSSPNSRSKRFPSSKQQPR